MNACKVAKGKLNCVINFSKLIAQMLQSTSKDGSPEGADLFIPSAIYILL